MSDQDSKEKEGFSAAGSPICEEYARSRREGVFLSPFGTEGCQWDGFPEAPDEESEPDPISESKKSE